MAVTIFAAIDVGSHETSMRIYEISKKYGVHEMLRYRVRFIVTCVMMRVENEGLN